MIDYNKNYKLLIDKFNVEIKYDEYCNKLIEIIKIRWNTQFKIKYKNNKYNDCNDFETFCNMIDDEEIIYCNYLINSKIDNAIKAERSRIRENRLTEIKKMRIKQK